MNNVEICLIEGFKYVIALWNACRLRSLSRLLVFPHKIHKFQSIGAIIFFIGAAFLSFWLVSGLFPVSQVNLISYDGYALHMLHMGSMVSNRNKYSVEEEVRSIFDGIEYYTIIMQCSERVFKEELHHMSEEHQQGQNGRPYTPAERLCVALFQTLAERCCRGFLWEASRDIYSSCLNDSKVRLYVPLACNEDKATSSKMWFRIDKETQQERKMCFDTKWNNAALGDVHPSLKIRRNRGGGGWQGSSVGAKHILDFPLPVFHISNKKKKFPLLEAILKAYRSCVKRGEGEWCSYFGFPTARFWPNAHYCKA